MFEEHPVYHHWLAFALYKVWCSAKEQVNERKETITLTIESDEFSVSLEALKTALNFCTKAFDMPDLPLSDFGPRHSSRLAKMETCQSGVCSIALSELIASPRGKILHQIPTRKKVGKKGAPETADYYGAIFDSDGKICSGFLGGDHKQPGEYTKGLTQTAKYIHDIIEERSTPKNGPNPLVLGLTMTKDKKSLYLFALGALRIWGMPIAIATSDHADLAFYATLYAASHYMIKNYRVQESGLLERPILCLHSDYLPLQYGAKCRVFLHEEEYQVKKFF